MLPVMSRLAVLALLIGACGNGSKQPSDQPKPAEATGQGAGKVAVPGAGLPEGTDGAKGGAEGARSGGAPEVPAGTGSGATVGAQDPCALTDATKQRAQNPAFQLKPEEGTLTIAKVEGKPKAAGTAEIKLAPGTGFHVANDYPIKLLLESPTGVTLEKACFRAGGRDKSQGDAATLSEQALAFAVKATAETAGAYEIKGVFSFGICEKDSCHPRTQPITIQVAVN